MALMKQLLALPRASRPVLLSRRRWLLFTVAGLAALPLAARRVRRRRPGEPGPTGWFGHC